MGDSECVGSVNRSAGQCGRGSRYNFTPYCDYDSTFEGLQFVLLIIVKFHCHSPHSLPPSATLPPFLPPFRFTAQFARSGVLSISTHIFPLPTFVFHNERLFDIEVGGSRKGLHIEVHGPPRSTAGGGTLHVAIDDST